MVRYMNDDIREEYDIQALNPRKNPYAKKIKKTVSAGQIIPLQKNSEIIVKISVKIV